METPFVELLTAVNNILPFMEENTVTSIETRHPTVALILSKIEAARLLVLSKGYWFNQETCTYNSNLEGKVEVGTNTLAVYPEDKSSVYTVRGKYIYDLSNSSFDVPVPFKADIVVDLTFDELPHFAALCVQWRAAVEAYSQDFQSDAVVQLLHAREQEAFGMLQREHLRNKQYSSMRSPAGFRFLNSLRA